MRKVWIAGLGNPGARFERTRHNLGFRTLRRLAERLDVQISLEKHQSLYARAAVEGAQVFLILPQTYMNLSGNCLAEWKRREGLDPARLLVVCDDMDLPLGRLRLRRSGSAGSHNGLASVVERLGGGDFARLRLGIGKPPRPEDWADFVTSPFAPEEREAVEALVERAAEAARLWAAGVDMERLMSKVNA